MKRNLFLLILVFFYISCVPVVTPVAPTATQVLGPTLQYTLTSRATTQATKETYQPQPVEWWQKAVFYEVFVRSFYDSNADGIGDFNGITAKLDYLNDGNPATNTDLGINAIWLMPIHPSPTYHGYDVLDYYQVNPQYGSMEDFKHLLSEAHRRGIRVIIDLVINHTSSQSAWFTQANDDQQSKYRDWYVWSPTNPGGGWHPGKVGFYYGYFDASMPDLNYRNPAVTAEIGNVVRFWLEEVGVDGFRIDAAKHLLEDGAKHENVLETYQWFQGFYKTYKAINPHAYTVGEVAGAGARLVSTYTGDKMDMVFNFELASGIINSVKGEADSGITSAIKFVLADMPGWQFGTFLTNHDQNRVMSTLNGNVDKAKAAATILLTLPGTPFIYYGEEIAMMGVKPDEDIRRPMQWNSDIKAGFTSATPWRSADQANLKANVADEMSDPVSLLSHYRRLITLRMKYLAEPDGEVALVSTENRGVYALLRRMPAGAVLVLVNLTGKQIDDYNLSLSEPILAPGTYSVASILGSEISLKLNVQNGSFTGFKPVGELIPYGSYIYSLQLP